MACYMYLPGKQNLSANKKACTKCNTRTNLLKWHATKKSTAEFIFLVHLDISKFPIMNQSWIETSTSPRAYLGHLTTFSSRGVGNLIPTHKGWGIWILILISCYVSQWLNAGCRPKCGQYGEFKGFKRNNSLLLCDNLNKNQRNTKVFFCILDWTADLIDTKFSGRQQF